MSFLCRCTSLIVISCDTLIVLQNFKTERSTVGVKRSSVEYIHVTPYFHQTPVQKALEITAPHLTGQYPGYTPRNEHTQMTRPYYHASYMKHPNIHHTQCKDTAN